MKSALFLIASLVSLAMAAPMGPDGPCAQAKVDAILNGNMQPEECCSYGKCKGHVVIAVGE
ncbi:hypothetical protein VHEMI04953 [[Torrubiella] hemipterigena]|uniref:Uncharacterized protein n=1 Tax=[Torrubiella] hemipterigena TaxID=1531966 RepID=A0A0A1TFD1_9HYPO|nr:hypothetical protein VHEMI04953 [[Torrubiella] hemipterigena]